MFSCTVRSYFSVCFTVVLGQHLSWKNKTNPGPNRQAGLIKRSGVRKALRELHQLDLCFVLHWVSFYLCHFPLDLFFYELFKHGHFTSTINFQRKANKRNNNKLNSLRTTPVLAAGERPASCLRACLWWELPKSSFVRSPLASVHLTAPAPISNREDM